MRTDANRAAHPCTGLFFNGKVCPRFGARFSIFFEGLH